MPSFEPSATSFSAANALYLGLASELAYSDEAPLKGSIQRILGMDPARTITFARGDTEGYAVVDGEKVILAFRGSEAPTSPDGIQDWLRDFDGITVPLSNYVNGGPFNAKIHKGFADGMHDVIAPVITALFKLDPNSSLPLWITGHSLGGALAVAAAVFFRFDSHLKRDVKGLYTYGQPRVASPVLALALGQEFGSRYQRVINHLDIVARVPPRGAFHEFEDAGVVEWFDDNGDLNPNEGPTHADLFKDSFEDLITGAAGDNPLAGFFSTLGGNLTKPATDHSLRTLLFVHPPQLNPKSYLAKLANLAGAPLPAEP